LALIAGLPFGPIGIVTAYTIVMFALFVPTLVYAGRPAGIGVRHVLQATGPQTVAGLIAVAFGYMIQQEFLADVSELIRFLISVPICLAAYFTVVVGVFKVTGPIRLVCSVLRELSPVRIARQLLT